MPGTRDFRTPETYAQRIQRIYAARAAQQEAVIAAIEEEENESAEIGTDSTSTEDSSEESLPKPQAKTSARNTRAATRRRRT